MTNVLKGISTVIAVVVIAIVLVVITQGIIASAEAPSGIQSTQRVATTTVVGPSNVVTIFTANTTCTSRTISITDGSGIGITFLMGDPTNGDLASTTLSAINGHIQTASTTVTYNSGLNGCGRWTAYSTASTTLTLVENQ